MMSDKIVVPKFASESEEADWWFEQREEHGGIMARAIDDGRTINMQQLLEQQEAKGVMRPPEKRMNWDAFLQAADGEGTTPGFVDAGSAGGTGRGAAVNIPWVPVINRLRQLFLSARLG